MIEQSIPNHTEVAIIKSTTPEEATIEGIKSLGGISKFINKDEQIFIKINLRLPNGFPTHTNFDLIKSVVNLCKEGGVKKIYIGSFPLKGITTQSFSELMGVQEYFESIGAHLAYLDDYSNYPYQIVSVQDKEFKVPQVILNSDKLILINQINVDPLFKLTLSPLNSYSIVSDKYRKIVKILREGKDYLFLDQYKKDLVSNIIDVFSIKKPCFSINDFYFTLEGAGPYIYKDSNLVKTNLIAMGKDAIAVDYITLKLMNLDPMKNELIIEAREKKLGITDLSKITTVGEKLDKFILDIKLCVSKLENINVQNTSIKRGQFCSGCFKQAYHLLNLMKTNMIKDLKYIRKQSFLIGEKPQEPEYLENIILFGDCAINSTKDRSFRKIVIKKKKSFLDDAKEKLKKDKKPVLKKNKQKKNKQILELPGCPPDLNECINYLTNYYRKTDLPNLNFYKNIIETFRTEEKSETLSKEGVL